MGRKKTAQERFLSGTDNQSGTGPQGEYYWDPAVDDASDPNNVQAPPLWLANPYGKAEWYRLLPLMMQHNIISEGSLHVLAVMCGVFGRICEALAQNLTPNVQALSLYRQLANDFGLTPVSQSKVKPLGEKKEKKNAFSANGDPMPPPNAKPATRTPSFSRNA